MLPSWVSPIAIVVPPAPDVFLRTVSAASCVLVPVPEEKNILLVKSYIWFSHFNSLSAELHSIMGAHAVAKGGESVVESANCEHISVSWTNLCVSIRNYHCLMFDTNLELIIDGHIGLLVIVGHGYLQLVRLLAGQLMKGVKTNPTLA